jgi:signal transduction histidine kinase
MAAFIVRDNGIGIAAEHHDAIFQVFRRLHTAQEFDGTGIGLALCKRVAERHGGAISVHSAPGQGSTFLVRLPRSHSSAADGTRA